MDIILSLKLNFKDISFLIKLIYFSMKIFIFSSNKRFNLEFNAFIIILIINKVYLLLFFIFIIDIKFFKDKIFNFNSSGMMISWYNSVNFI